MNDLQRNDPKHPYRKDGDTWLVELRLETLEQLFNTLDPSPFWKRDLDPEAADYLLECVDEIPEKEAIRLVIYANVIELKSARELATRTIHDYFLYRARVNHQRLRRELRKGRASLTVGLVFLALCFGISEMLAPIEGIAGTVLREGFIIMGWVAMWRPLEIFLYDWWPYLGRVKLHERIARLPVEIYDMRENPPKAPIVTTQATT